MAAVGPNRTQAVAELIERAQKEKVMSEEQAVETQEVETVDAAPLNDVFGNAEPTGVEHVETPSTDQPEPEMDVKEEEPSSPEPEPETPEPTQKSERDLGLEKALVAERQKRQAAEFALQQNQVPEEKKEFWDDPEARLEAMANDLRAESQRNLLNLSESHAKARYEDYQDKYDVFKNMATENPSLINQMLSQPDPAEWAYRQAEKQAFAQEIGEDPTAYRAKIEAEIRAEVEKEFNNKVAEKVNKVSGLPPAAGSLTNKRATPKPISNKPLKDPGILPVLA